MNKFQQLVSEWEVEGYRLIDSNLITFTNEGVTLSFYLDEVMIHRKSESLKVVSYLTAAEINLIKRTMEFLPALFELKEEAYAADLEVVIREDGSIFLEYEHNGLANLREEVYNGVGHVNY